VFLAAPPLQGVITCNRRGGIDERRAEHAPTSATIVGDNTNEASHQQKYAKSIYFSGVLLFAE